MGRSLLPALAALVLVPLAALAAFVTLGAGGCGGERPAGLTDRTAHSGIRFRHDNGFRGPFYFPETIASGVASCDLDSDGDLDVYAVQAGIVPGSLAAAGEASHHPTNQLFANRGDGTFDDVTDASGDAAHAGYGMGTCAGDVNGDGLPDLFLTNTGPDALLLNEGGLAFRDAALGTPLADPRWTTGCGFADLDQDGHLDLVVASYVEWSAETEHECMAGGVRDYCHVSIYTGLADRVWKGDGRGGFRDDTAAHDVGARTGRGLGLALVDFDRDGDVDLYVANDSVENHFYLNEGGRLVDATDRSGAAYSADGLPEAGMGVAVGDLDDNGSPDVLVTNFTGESNSVYVNQGAGTFREASRQTGIAVPSRPALGFGIALADLDRDGVLDFLVSNGHVMRNAGREGSPWRFAQPAQLFRGARDGPRLSFELWGGAGAVLDVPRVGRGLAAGDLDGDGEVDFVLSSSGGDLLVVGTKLAEPGTHWLRARLVARGSNTSGIGAFVGLILDDGRVLRRWVQSGTGYLGQDDLAPLFGIPRGARPVRARVRWPDGTQSSEPVEAWDRTVEIRQP